MTKTNIFKPTSILLVAFSLGFLVSCTKDEKDPAASATVESNQQAIQVTDKATQKELERIAREMPTIAWYNTAMNKIISFDPQNNSKSFDFSDPNPGWNFSDASETAWYPAENGGGILFIGAGSFGGNTGSGTVVAGNTTLDVNYTFCFAASDQALGLDLIDLGGTPDLDGISGVIGIAGDFSALQNEEVDEDADIYDFFQGLAYYVVYDNEAAGNYDILNWFNNLEEEPDNLANKGLAWVYSFSPQEWAIYFSKDGSLDVSGGSMNFNGNYLGITFNFENLLNDDDGDIYDFNFVEVPGFGEMGCS